ncbi:MAG: DUF4147 domain-containing protein [Deltaproteobacteria bacterium]|nr:MAG: DUF4147 domain-containing protein [Deltaproteobacteria bacterium]
MSPGSVGHLGSRATPGSATGPHTGRGRRTRIFFRSSSASVVVAVLLDASRILAGCPRLAAWPEGLVVARALERALAATCPRTLVARALASLDLGPRCAVLAMGKAASAMAAGAAGALDGRIVCGLVVAKHAPEALPPPFACVVGDHPVPGPASLAAGRAVVDFVEGLAPDLPLVVAISGGTSSLAVAPKAGLDPKTLAEASRRALSAGLDIGRTNALRMRLDRLKGGGLARLAGRRTVVGLVLSDVPGHDAAFVGSGPLSPPPPVPLERIASDARALGLPPSVTRLLARPSEPPPKVPLLVLADPHTAAHAAAEVLEDAGFRTIVDATAVEGVARDVGGRLARAPRSPGRTARVAAGETTVRVEGAGIGGRNTELALAAALALAEGPKETTRDRRVVAFATDGEDGTAPSAGGIADARLAADLRAAGIDPTDALARNDSYSALAAAGAALHTGPTGTNVADLILVLDGGAGH